MMHRPHTARVHQPGDHEQGPTPPELAARVAAVLAARGIRGAVDALKLHRVTLLRIAAGQTAKRFILADVRARLDELDATRAA